MLDLGPGTFMPYLSSASIAALIVFRSGANREHDLSKRVRAVGVVNTCWDLSLLFHSHVVNHVKNHIHNVGRLPNSHC